MVEGECTLTSTGINKSTVRAVPDTEEINISGSGTLNVNSESCGIEGETTKSDFNCSVSIRDINANFKCSEEAVRARDKIQIENAVIDVQCRVPDNTYDDVAFEARDKGIYVTNSTVTVTGVFNAFACGQTGPLVIENSTVKADVRHGIDVYPGENDEPIRIVGSTFELKSSASGKGIAFCFEGDTEIEDSRVIVESTGNTAMDGWGGLRVSGNSYVSLTGAKKALSLTSALELGDGLEITSGEMAENNKSSTTPDLVIASTIADSEVDPAAQAGGAVAAVIVGTAAVGATALAAYSIGTTLYLNANLPAGLVVPSNREELALAVWEKAGKPEPVSSELYSDIDKDADDAQKASHWMVEQGLMTEDKADTFAPFRAVSKLRVCMTWQNAKDKGLI